jgi:hypothetical protein
MKLRILHKLWGWWHCDLRRFFDWFDARLRGKDPNDWMYACRYAPECRPWWHLCCNGNAGGWRTNLCDALEWRWRAIEDLKYGENND